jgi:CAAX protease family protein
MTVHRRRGSTSGDRAARPVRKRSLLSIPAARTIRGLLLRFFTLTYIVSWTCFIAWALVSGPTPSMTSRRAVLATPLLLVGVFAPSLVALALTALADGRSGALTLLRRTFEWPTGVRWYLFALGYMAAIKLAAGALQRLLTGGWPAFGQAPLLIMAGAIVVSTPVQAGEEIGWRGYALPRLSNSFGLPLASIVLGVIWACWHLPFFFIQRADTFGQSFPVYLLSVTAISVAMAWLYWRTNGSLLLTMMLHAAVNNTKDIVPSAAAAPANPFALNASLVAWLSAAILWLCASYFLLQMRGARLPLVRETTTRTGQAVVAKPVEFESHRR